MDGPDTFPVATDIAVFTVIAGKLQVLLVERRYEPFKGSWALPGGFMKPGEGLDACAARELQEEAGLSGVYLEQLASFGDPGRDPRGQVISVAYFALVPARANTPVADTDAADARWHAMDKLPDLAFDHAKILAMAHERLKAKVEYSTIAMCLLPECFTLSELQTVHEIIRGEALDKRNFRKWLLGLDVVEETGDKRVEGAHRPAMLYRAKVPGEVIIVR